MLLTLSSNFVSQILPNFVLQRSIYEARERPAKTYSWLVFLLSNILVELPWNSLMAVLVFVTWYYPIGFYRNADTAVAEHGGTMFLLIWVYFMYSTTFAYLIQAGVELAEMAGSYANLLFIFSLVFCGILASPSALPRFWIFMYRLSPFTYLVAAILAVGLDGAPVRCAPLELLHFAPPTGIDCANYLDSYIRLRGGYLVDPAATADCAFCPIADTTTFLATYLDIDFADRWRDFGILWVYVLVNIAGAMALYWLVRMPKKSARKG
jgi:ATP-binding cassette, subfamily G (WHITE), member 2, PDR